MSNQGSTSRKIIFEVGTRIEAQDFTQNWYPAKICRIDSSHRKALIHFEGWNHRFDEWISFESEKIRPSTRSVDYKEEKAVKLSQEWNVGDRLLAKWIDGKFYSAKVTKKNDDGTLEVLFYDGFKKNVQRSNVKPDNRKVQVLPVSKDRLSEQTERMERKSKLANARAQRALKRSKELNASKSREKTKKSRQDSESRTTRESTSASSPVSDSVSMDDDIKNISGSSSYTAEESEPKSVDTSLEDNEDIKPRSSPKKACSEIIVDKSKLEISKLDEKYASKTVPKDDGTSEESVPVGSNAEATCKETSNKQTTKKETTSEQMTTETISTANEETSKLTEEATNHQSSVKNKSIVEKPSTQGSNEDLDMSYIEVVSVEAKDIQAKVEEESVSENVPVKENTSITTGIEVNNIDSNNTTGESIATGSKMVPKKIKISPKMVKKQRASLGQSGERKRAARSRSAISPRGYGYSMAVMHPQAPKQETLPARSEVDSHNTTPQENSLDNIMESLGEDSAIVEIQPVADSKEESSQENSTPASKGKAKHFQAKKFRLDQITGKLSAQRQIEAEAAVQSPSAFQMTVSPPPVAIPPPPRVPSPTISGHYPMDTNYNVPPPLIYAPPRPPCCSNPHCQQHYATPPRMTHPIHLAPSHLHPHSAGGYVMYPPGPPSYETRPPLACSCSNCTTSVYHMHQDGPSRQESALARLMQVEQRILHSGPRQHIPHYREGPPPHGPWLPRSLPHATQYCPLPPKQEEIKWRHDRPHQAKSPSHVSPTSESEAAKMILRWKVTEKPVPLKATNHDIKTTEITPKEPMSLDNKQPESPVVKPKIVEKTPQQELLSVQKPIEKTTQVTSDIVISTTAATSTIASSNNPLGGRPRKGKEPAPPAPKELIIDLDHNKFKCPIKGCDKSFRKESGLDYHIKYYHSPGGKEIKRKRSSASMRSDGTPESSPDVTSPSVTKRRHRSSAPGQLTTEQCPTDMSTSPIEADDVLEPLAQDMELDIEPGTETDPRDFGSFESVVEEEVTRDGDVVRCRCLETEEGGFMIQCEQCLTWQHSECVGLTEQTVPSKYLCYVCSNPKGLRRSAKYKNDFDWYKKGSLSKFSFAKKRKDSIEYDSEVSLATHDLVADLHDVSHVLNSLRVKLDILGSPNHPALGMWYKEPEKEQQPVSVTPDKDYSSSLLMVKPLSNGKPSLTDHNQNGIDSTFSETGLLNGEVANQQKPLGLNVDETTVSVSESDAVSPLPPLVRVGATLVPNEMPDSSIQHKESLNYSESSSKETSFDTIKPGELQTLQTQSVDKDRADSESNETWSHVAMINLLDDVSELQESLETRLDVLEKQIEVLEKTTQPVKEDDTKPDLRKLVKDLSRIKRLALHVG